MTAAEVLDVALRGQTPRAVDINDAAKNSAEAKLLGQHAAHIVRLVRSGSPRGAAALAEEALSQMRLPPSATITVTRSAPDETTGSGPDSRRETAEPDGVGVIGSPAAEHGQDAP